MTTTTVESPGKRLHDKRLEKQMSVADAARLTRIRPDRILDLEKDDYSNFPSLSYARGFLLIYSGLLGVDVSEAAVRLENSNPVDIEEYEYLSGKPAPLTRTLGVGRRVFTVLFVIVSVMVALVAFILHVVNSASRLDDFGQLSQKDQQSLHAPVPQPTSAVPTPTAAPAASAPTAAAEPSAPRAIAVEPAASASPAPAAPADNSVTIRPLKKVWVKIHKDSTDSEPVYEDWLFPDTNGLSLHGGKFFIEVGSADAVEIMKNGQVIPYNNPGIVVQ
jgi:cytoskeletal protein RodZ